jgi:hypothetical protein
MTQLPQLQPLPLLLLNLFLSGKLFGLQVEIPKNLQDKINKNCLRESQKILFFWKETPPKLLETDLSNHTEAWSDKFLGTFFQF